MSQPQAKKNPPEKKISPINSGITVAIWLNEVQTDKGTRYFRTNVAELVMWRRFPMGRVCLRFRSPTAT